MSNSDVSAVRSNKINSFTGVKVIAMLMIFWLHSPLLKPAVDLGSRACELLFVLSGFLVGYNGFYKNVPATWKESALCVLRKVIVFWPLHCILTLFELYRFYRVFSVDNFIKTFLHLTFLQAWSTNVDVYFAYNGASWFLSALLFCYFMSPVLMKLIKRKRCVIGIFVIAFAVRFIAEYIAIYYPDQFLKYDIHVSPIIRCMEFFMGMLLVPIYYGLRNKIDNIRIGIVYSIVELVVVGSTISLIIVYTLWYRAIFVLIYCMLLFILAFDKGILSRLLGAKPFQMFNSIQFEFYLLHQPVIRSLKYSNIMIGDEVVISVLAFVITIVIAYIYKKYISGFCTLIMRKSINFILLGLVEDYEING